MKKKILSIFLVVCMLATALATSVSAAVIDTDTISGMTYYYSFRQNASRFHPIDVTGNPTVMQMKVMFSNPANATKVNWDNREYSYGEGEIQGNNYDNIVDSYITAYGDYVHQESTGLSPAVYRDRIGLSSTVRDKWGINLSELPENFVTLDEALSFDKWYTIRWETKGETTEISVDGTVVGTLNAKLDVNNHNQLWLYYEWIAIDDFLVGNTLYDFETEENVAAWNRILESGENNGGNYQAPLGKLIGERAGDDTTVNVIEYTPDPTSSKVIKAGGYFYINDIPTTSKSYSRVSFDFMLPTGCDSFSTWTYAADWMNLSISKTAINGATLPTALTNNTWYHISILNNGSNVYISVDNGEATLDNYTVTSTTPAVGSVICTSATGPSFDNFKVEDSNDGVSFTQLGYETFEDSTWNSCGEIPGDNGVAYSIETATVKGSTVTEPVYDYYCKTPVDEKVTGTVTFTDNPSNTTEINVRFDDSIDNVIGETADSYVKVGGIKIAKNAYNLTQGTWYKVKLVNNGSNTTVWIDGNNKGTVSGTVAYSGKTLAIEALDASIDNIRNNGEETEIGFETAAEVTGLFADAEQYKYFGNKFDAATVYTAITLDNEITVDAYVKGILGNDDNVSVSINGAAATTKKTSNGTLTFDTIALKDPSLMGEDITITLTAGTATKTFTISIEKYLKAVLDNKAIYETYYGTEFTDLCSKTLSFGEAARVYNGVAGDPINAGYEVDYTETEIAPAAAEPSNVIASKAVTGTAALAIDEAFHLDFTFEGTVDFSTASVYNDVLDDASDFVTTNGNTLSVKLGARHLASAYTVALPTAQLEGEKYVDINTFVTINIFQYLAQVEATTNDDTLKTFAKAIYEYGVAARAYADLYEID